MRPAAPRMQLLLAPTLALVAAACGGGTVATASPSAAATAAPTPSPAAVSSAPADETIPAALVGTWVGEEKDVDLGVTWASTYRIDDCARHTEPWKDATDAQACGDWFGTSNFQGRPANCSGTLSWLGMKDDAYELLGSAPVGIDPELCWDTWRIYLTPDGAGGFTVVTTGDGNPSTSGSVAPAPGS